MGPAHAPQARRSHAGARPGGAEQDDHGRQGGPAEECRHGCGWLFCRQGWGGGSVGDTSQSLAPAPAQLPPVMGTCADCADCSSPNQEAGCTNSNLACLRGWGSESLGRSHSFHRSAATSFNCSGASPRCWKDVERVGKMRMKLKIGEEWDEVGNFRRRRSCRPLPPPRLAESAALPAGADAAPPQAFQSNLHAPKEFGSAASHWQEACRPGRMRLRRHRRGSGPSCGDAPVSAC